MNEQEFHPGSVPVAVVARVYGKDASWVRAGITGFSSDPSEQKGHYLALKFDVAPADATTTVELVGGTKGAVALDEDKNIVLPIKNNSQSVKVISTKDSSSVTKIYTLTGLTLES